MGWFLNSAKPITSHTTRSAGSRRRLMDALPVAAKQLGLAPTGTRTSVEVGIGQTATGGYALDVDLHVEVQGLDEAAARKLVEATHQVCPYSNATRGNIDVRLHVSVA